MTSHGSGMIIAEYALKLVIDVTNKLRVSRDPRKKKVEIF